MNTWKLLLKILRTKNAGKIFTRAEILRDFYHSQHIFNMNTLHTYLNTLKRAGYLKYEEPGVYRKLKPLIDISEYQLKKKIKKLTPEKPKFKGSVIKGTYYGYY